jgi:hypothetical protein
MDDNIHPAADDARNAVGHNGPLLDAVERHVHQQYCQRKKNVSKENDECRFDYPKDLNDVCHIVVIEYIVNKKKGEKEKRIKLEIMSKRNDRWLNSHMDPLMRVWRANMDMQLTINLGKVIGYMTKYVTKMEASLTKGAQAMMARVLTKSIADGHTAQHALRKGMGKNVG